MDGWATLPAASVRLSCWRADAIGPGSDVRDHGTAAIPRHHDAGAGDDVWFRLAAGGDARGRRLAAAVDLGEARAGIAVDPLPFRARGLAACVCRRPGTAPGALLPHRQRAADSGDDRDRYIRRC